jgi:hypothetical protein
LGGIERMKRKPLVVGALVCCVVYVGAFVVVHRSLTLRKPAANMAYWYYSDNEAIETMQYYGFLPARRFAYHIPCFSAQHYRERTAWSSATGDMTPEEIERVSREVYGSTNQPTGN